MEYHRLEEERIEMDNYPPESLDIPFLAPEYFSITGYQHSIFKMSIFSLLSILSFGFLFILTNHYPKLFVHLARNEVKSMRDAEYLLLESAGGIFTLVCVKKLRLTEDMVDLVGVQMQLKDLAYFEYRKQRYVFKESQSSFQRLDPRLSKSIQEILAMASGLSTSQAAYLYSFHGPNAFQIESIPMIKMFLDKVSHPFYLFQVLSTVIWLVEGYTVYALIIFLMSLASVLWEVFTAKKNESNLRALAATIDTVTVIRNLTAVEIQSSEIVVGDAIILFPNSMAFCDMALVRANSVVVDESSLTGESVPIVKSPLPIERGNEEFSMEKHKKYIIFSGSRILQTRLSSALNTVSDSVLSNKCIGIATSTGFSSTKGELFRSILYPKDIDVKFYRDSYKFMLILVMVAAVTFCKNLIDGISDQKSFIEILVRSIDLLTIAGIALRNLYLVPPALPLVLTVGVGFALARLKKDRIFCISPERINFAGSVKLMAWDKTGTLTDSLLQWYGCEEAIGSVFLGFQKGLCEGGKFAEHDVPSHFEKCLASCNGINIVNKTMVGHSVDIAGFTASGWTFHQEENQGLSIHLNGTDFEIAAKISNGANCAIAILKRFDFDPHVQLNTILCADVNNTDVDFIAYTKGSPEAIRTACNMRTLPANYYAVYNDYTSRGFYVLAMAYRNLSIGEGNIKIVLPRSASSNSLCAIRRSTVEQHMIFAGFLILENPMKQESKEVIADLANANIRSVIITGDNASTAIHCARELNLCDKVVLCDVWESSIQFWEIPNKNGDKLSTHIRPLAEKGGSKLQNSVSMRNIPAISDFERYSIDELSNFVIMSRVPIDIVLTGAALEEILKAFGDPYINWLICRARIFARCKPDQKTWIIERLIQQNQIVGMCGDGVNDCGALKAAHVGIAMSDCEASMVAPFTSGSLRVSDVGKIFGEGRCALETSFAAFKYMVIYPIIQITITSTLYGSDTSLSNNQYLFDDVFLVLLAALFMCYTAPRKLAGNAPTSNLFSPQMIASLVGLVAINLSFFFINTLILYGQPWFCSTRTAASIYPLDSWTPFQPNTTNPCYVVDPVSDTAPHFHVLTRTYETTVTWLFGHAQYIGVAVALSIYSKCRQAIWANALFTCFLLLSMPILVFLWFATESGDVGQFLNLRGGMPEDYRFWMCVLSFVNALACCLWEYYVVGLVVTKWAARRDEVALKAEALKRAKGAGVLRTLAVFVQKNGISSGGNGMQRSISTPCQIGSSNKNEDSEMAIRWNKGGFSPI